MKTMQPAARICAAIAAIGVTLSLFTAMTGLANHYAQAAAAQGLTGAEARGNSTGDTRVAAARSTAENAGCKPGRASAG